MNEKPKITDAATVTMETYPVPHPHLQLVERVKVEDGGKVDKEPAK